MKLRGLYRCRLPYEIEVETGSKINDIQFTDLGRLVTILPLVWTDPGYKPTQQLTDLLGPETEGTTRYKLFPERAVLAVNTLRIAIDFEWNQFPPFPAKSEPLETELLKQAEDINDRYLRVLRDILVSQGQIRPTNLLIWDIRFISESGRWEPGRSSSAELTVALLKPSVSLKVASHLQSGQLPELWREVWLEAVDAIYRDERQAALLGAVAAEVFIKQYLQNKAPSPRPAGLSPFLQARSRKPMIDFFDDGLLSATGKSLRAEKLLLYDSVDLLFQVRNKVAHKAKAEYNEGPSTISVGTDDVKNYLRDLLSAIQWIQTI